MEKSLCLLLVLTIFLIMASAHAGEKEDLKVKLADNFLQTQALQKQYDIIQKQLEPIQKEAAAIQVDNKRIMDRLAELNKAEEPKTTEKPKVKTK